jgi:DNA (cytosine-5)-methyltransferase 1
MRKALDLFCGAGGATRGLQRAGFHVTGVDLHPQPFYCGDAFIQADAFDPGIAFDPFDLIWASPPCQRYSQMSARWRGRVEKEDLLIPVIHGLLGRRAQPWVVENVVGAKRLMPGAFTLHGGMFNLRVYRPRLFLANFPVSVQKRPMPKDPIGVYDNRPHGMGPFRLRWNGNFKGRSVLRIARTLEEAQDAMGMDWADWKGVKEAIPPAYAEYIGRQAP